MNLKITILKDVIKNYLLVAALFFSMQVRAQLAENFSDGNFTYNPAWSGSADQFTVNSALQLQLNNSVAATSYLSTPFQTNTLDSTIWQTTVRQSFSSSSSNFGRVYLTSDQPDLTGSLHGYYLQFGESGSNDAIELFRQNGTTSVSVCRGRNGAIAASFIVNVKVVRSQAGLWEISTDFKATNNFTSEATGVDSTYHTSGFFGVVCTYTSSNAGKFYYDDFYAGQKVKDTVAPTVTSVLATSANMITVMYSEAVEPASAENISFYAASNGIGFPTSATLLQDQKTVLLAFGKNFGNGIQNQLSISGVQDVARNIISGSNWPFKFLQIRRAEKRDVIMTEIFPDPDPVIGLPAAEYIELYNRSEAPVDMTGWTLSDGSSNAIFTGLILIDDHYQIITSTSNAKFFSANGNVTGLDNFPSLNNGGDALTLRESGGKIIDSLNYSIDWYHDKSKQNGGWSLELIDRTNHCSNADNWTSSENPIGGTPGIQNSVDAIKPDVTGPLLSHLSVMDDDIIKLSFNEPLDSATVLEGIFVIEPRLDITKVSFTDMSLRDITIGLRSGISPGVLYSLSLENITDCSSNPLQPQSSTEFFSLPEAADSLDILVNEILFNPRPSGVDFVEVFNNSAKYIRLNGFKLANFEEGVLKNVVEISADDVVMSPKSWLVFTSDSSVLKNNYPSGHQSSFLVTSLPSLPDDAGSVALVDLNGKVIDFFVYDAGYHTKLLKDAEGVSLERVSVTAPGHERQNWKSASSQCGFATPGYLNSASRPDKEVPSGKVLIDPAIICPGSGYAEFAKIEYNFATAGYVLNLSILDQQGRLIRMISNNETLGTEGFFRWDGDRDDGSRARTGYYVVSFEVFDLSGFSKIFRKRVIIAAR